MCVCVCVFAYECVCVFKRIIVSVRVKCWLVWREVYVREACWGVGVKISKRRYVKKIYLFLYGYNLQAFNISFCALS